MYSGGVIWHKVVILICHPYTVRCRTCGLDVWNQTSTQGPSIHVEPGYPDPLIYPIVESGFEYENRTK